MRHLKKEAAPVAGVVLALAILAPLGCSSASSGALTPHELAEILGVKVWRLPELPAGQEWTIGVENASELPKTRQTVGSISRSTSGRVTLRPVAADDYEFTLRHKAGQSSGITTPCAEAADAQPICDGYSIEFFADPICLSACAGYVIARIEPTLGTAKSRHIVVRAVQSLTVLDNGETRAVPIP